MECPKCHKDTVVLVTSEAKRRVTEHKPIVLWILLFPFMFIWWLFRVAFVGKKQKYFKKQHYHCNYCGHDWDWKPTDNT